jgi:hypothetical protein
LGDWGVSVQNAREGLDGRGYRSHQHRSFTFANKNEHYVLFLVIENHYIKAQRLQGAEVP